MGHDESGSGTSKSGSHFLVVSPNHDSGGAGCLVVGHRLSGGFNAILGGTRNRIRAGTLPTIVGGDTNLVESDHSVIVGGRSSCPKRTAAAWWAVCATIRGGPGC